MRPFRERNPLSLGIAGLATAGLATLLAFNLSVFTDDTTYSAAFAEAGGLKPGEEVRIAGVKVGKVTTVDLDGDHVKVEFTSNARFGSRSRAQIKIKTLLGSHYLALDNRGPGRQPANHAIPLSRTTPPYEVVPALQDVSRQVGRIDARQLARSLDAVNATMQGSPENVRRTLNGLQKISRAVASRDDELSRLLGHSRNVTKLLADRSGDLAVLIRDGGLLLREIHNRRTVVHQLLTGTIALSQQISATIDENQATLGPALKNLHRLNNVLLRNQANLEKTIQTMAPFYTTATDLTGNGRWFDNYIQNLVLLPASVAPPATGAPKNGPRTKPGTASPQNPLPFVP